MGQYQLWSTSDDTFKERSIKYESVSVIEKKTHIGAVKYLPIYFCHVNPKYQGLVFPRIVLEQTTTKIDFLKERIFRIFTRKGNKIIYRKYETIGRIWNTSDITKL